MSGEGGPGRAGAGTPSCLVCGRREWTLHLDKGAHRYVRCEGCELVRLDPFPSQEEAAALYGDEYFTAAASVGYADYIADAPLHRRNGRARVRRLGDPPPGAATLIDIGCAHGFTMLEARSRGWEPLGVETNDSARQSVVELGMRCERTVADLELGPCSVGAVALFQVLEHLTDPAEMLRWCSEVLHPDGKVVIETWDRGSLVARAFGPRWQQASPPSVVWLFDRSSLEGLASVAGLRLARFRPSSKWVSAGLVAGQMQSRGAGGPLARTMQALRRVPIPYAFGDLVTVVMDKPPLEGW